MARSELRNPIEKLKQIKVDLLAPDIARACKDTGLWYDYLKPLLQIETLTKNLKARAAIEERLNRKIKMENEG